MALASTLPAPGRELDEWILARRGARNTLDSRRPHAFLVEEERTHSGEIVSIATIFLTNRECPWRCLMCDLWKNTLAESVPAGAISEQIDWALAGLPAHPAPCQIKLYNSGSFFDTRAVPPEDHPAIARRVRAFERVIVECHPALVGESAVRFRDALGGAKLEVAMGLETAHPEVLRRLNKRMTLEQFSRAAEYLRVHDIALRVFILVKPPFLDETEALHWAGRSLDFAFDCGATAASLIPTRFGNGALEALAEKAEFAPPRLATLEAALNYGVSQNRGRAFADLWDLEKFTSCTTCFVERHERLRRMNLRQIVEPAIACAKCGGA